MIFARRVFFTLLPILLVFLAFSSPIEARERVGVLEFSGNVSLEYRTAAANRMTRILMDLQRFDVIDRSEMDRILTEQHFQMTGLVEMDTAVAAGRILGINQAFIGHIDQLTSSWDSASRRYRAEARVTVKVIDVQTSTLLHMMESSGTGSDENRTQANHRALEEALGEGFVTQLRSRFAITSIITRVDGSMVYMVGGQDMGIREGYRYRIMRPDDPGMGFYDAFTREIGLLEIVEVTATRSRGRIIYGKEPVAANDIALEVPYNTQSLMNFRVKVLGYSLNPGYVTGMAPMLEFSYITERPFGYSWEGLLGLTSLGGMLLFNVGVNGGVEVPISAGSLYLTASGNAGLYGAVQDHRSYQIGWTNYSAGTATAASFYLGGNAGIKYYLNYDKGVRINIGAGGQYGGALNSWENDRNHTMNQHVQYSEVMLSGFSIIASLSFPLGLMNF